MITLGLRAFKRVCRRTYAYLLLETGDKLLLESGDDILLF